MNEGPITVAATLQADGVTLRLAQKSALPPGPVVVTVHPARSGAGPAMLEVLDRIHLDQRQRGRRPMTEEEMAAEVAALRAEDAEHEERWRRAWSQSGASLRSG